MNWAVMTDLPNDVLAIVNQFNETICQALDAYAERTGVLPSDIVKELEYQGSWPMAHAYEDWRQSWRWTR